MLKERGVLRGVFVQEHVVANLVVHRPDETRHRHVVTRYANRIRHRVAASAVVAHLVAMVHIELVPFEVAVRLVEIGGDGLCVNLKHAALHFCRVGEVTVVGDAAVFLAGVVIVGEERLRLVAVADV